MVSSHPIREYSSLRHNNRVEDKRKIEKSNNKMEKGNPKLTHLQHRAMLTQTYRRTRVRRDFYSKPTDFLLQSALGQVFVHLASY